MTLREKLSGNYWVGKKKIERRKVDTPELLSLQMYHAFLFTIPSYVGNRLERLQGNMLWSGPGDKFKFPLVDWNTMCSPISNGGMGVHKLGTVAFGVLERKRPTRSNKVWGGLGRLDNKASVKNSWM